MKSFIAATLIALAAAAPGVEPTWADAPVKVTTTTTTTTPAKTWVDYKPTTTTTTEAKTWVDYKPTTTPVKVITTESKWVEWKDVTTTTPVKVITTTWADVPVVPATTWADYKPTTTSTPVVSYTKPAPVSTYTGAASKGAAGAGVVALAGLAMML